MSLYNQVRETMNKNSATQVLFRLKVPPRPEAWDEGKWVCLSDLVWSKETDNKLLTTPPGLWKGGKLPCAFKKKKKNH